MHAPHPGHWHLLLLPPALGLHSCVHPSWLEPEQSFPPIGETEITVALLSVQGVKDSTLVNIQNGSYLQVIRNVRCLMYMFLITAWLKQNTYNFKWHSLVRVIYAVRLRQDYMKSHKKACLHIHEFSSSFGSHCQPGETRCHCDLADLLN